MISLDLLQWPAMAVTIAASGLITSSQQRHKNWGFWMFIASNILWVVWGWQSKAYALVAMQFCLAAMNIRGAAKTDAPS
ncbi:MAG: hypothetical protein QFE16_14715 [Pseudomonadota bacterium]|nr:hypothetical protein [Pseudomonadota bacterium]